MECTPYRRMLDPGEELKMPRAGTTILDSGDEFPKLEIQRVGGGTLTLPDELGGSFGVVLFYRGHW